MLLSVNNYFNMNFTNHFKYFINHENVKHLPFILYKYMHSVIVKEK